MSSGKAPGWYPDPSGRAKTFRWWDGERWTQAMSESLWAPEPRNPAPYAAPAPQPSPSGPGSGRHVGPRVGPHVVEVEDTEPPDRRLLVIGAILGAVVLTGLVVAVVIWLRPGDPSTRPQAGDSPAASNGPSVEPSGGASGDPSGGASPPSSPPGDPTSDPSGEPGGSSEVPPGGGKLTFAAPGVPWQKAGSGLLRKDLEHQRAFVYNTEELFDGKRNWQANIFSGDLPDDAVPKGELSEMTRKVATWFLRTEWNSEPAAGPSKPEAVLVDGRAAYRTRVRVAYKFKGLKSTYDDIDVILVDYGPKRPLGLVMASIPQTHPQLWKQVDKTLQTVRLVK